MRKINFYLLRGLIREKDHWGDYPDRLLKQFPGSTLNYLEIPGTGQFFKQDSLWDMESIVDFCRKEFLKTKKDGELNIILCISLGGMVCSEWLKRHPKDFDAAILINSSFKGLSPFYKRVKPTAIFAFLKIALTFNRKEKEKKIIKLVINNVSEHEKTLKNWKEIDRNRPVSLKNAFRQLWSAATFKPLLSKPEYTKVLILASKGDKLCDYTCSIRIQHKWQGRIRFHLSGGHDLPADDPNWLTEHIKEFVHYNFAQ